MPAGKGTYGSKKGRPAKGKKVGTSKVKKKTPNAKKFMPGKTANWNNRQLHGNPGQKKGARIKKNKNRYEKK